ncbi:MAG TPA: hypothetical protein VHL80_15780 [Polyangia bacterium]|nr:hypothetical protein [Polyangia bacterium]
MLFPAHAAKPPRLVRGARPGSPLAAGALALLVSACTQRALVGGVEPPDQDAALPTYSTEPIDGPGFVDGHLHSHAVFNSVERVFWFGPPGDSSLAVYIFEDMPTCDDVSKQGWLASPKVRPADVMGITLGGDEPGVYRVVPEKPPRAGNAYILHVIDQADPIEESEGFSGSVTLTSVKPGESVSGAFEATFTTGMLQGSFNALPCPTGVEL